MLVIFHKQSSWWLKLRRAWWEPLNGEGGGWQQSFHILISPHSCSNTIALHKSFSRHAYSIIFFRPRFWSTSFPQWQHLGGWFNHGHITMQIMMMMLIAMWFAVAHDLCTMKSELVPNLLFANCYLFQVHLLICFSCEWAALGRACFRAQVRMIMVHTTPPPLPCLAGLRNSLDKNIWKYKCTVCKIHLADTVKNHWAFRKKSGGIYTKNDI